MYCVRANYGLNVGNFNFDYDKGRFSFKISTDLEGLKGNEITVIFSQLFGIALQTFEKYALGLKLITEKGMKEADVANFIDGT